jgi:low temperature requirement protein LtrA
VNGHLFQHRTGLFILLSLGQLIVDGLDIELESDAFNWTIVVNSALVICLAFIVKLLYFDVGQATNPKWNKTAERLFVLLHVPFNGAIVLAGVGPSQLLRQGTMTASARYVFLVALAVISLFFAVSLALQRGATRGPKFSRVAIRIVAAILLVILTLAPRSHLPGTALLALAVGIMALIFVWDLVSQIVNNQRWKQQLRDEHDEEQVKLLEEAEEEKFLVHGNEGNQHTFPGQ